MHAHNSSDDAENIAEKNRNNTASPRSHVNDETPISEPSADPLTPPTKGNASAWSPIEMSLMVSSVLLITLAAFEGLATVTIMPNVVADFHAESWFSVASGAAMAAQLISTVIAGALSDWRGPKPVLYLGFSLFTVGLLISALSPNILIFVVGRISQGLGGGFVIVPLYVLIGSLVTKKHRPTFFAAFSLAWVFPSLIGPAIAGFVTTHIGWRPVFWVVPIGALFALLPLISVMRRLESSVKQPPQSLKSLTLLALLGGTGVVLLQLSGALSGWQLLIVFLGGTVISLLTLPRLLPRGTFSARRGVPAIISTRFLAMGVHAGVGAFLPLVLQRVHGWSADTASLSVTLGSISWAIGAVIQARVTRSSMRIRLPQVGTALMVIGVVSTVTLLSQSLPVWIALAGWMCACSGVGLMHSTLSVLALEQTEQSKHGKVSSWLQVADSAGSALELAFVSIFMALWASTGIGGGLAYLPASIVALCVAVLAFVASLRIRFQQESLL